MGPQSIILLDEIEKAPVGVLNLLLPLKEGVETKSVSFEPFPREMLLHLEETLNAHVLGQPQAARAVSSSLFNYSAGLKRSGKPIGVFLFLGSTGVGKTELAKALSEQLFGSGSRIIRFDMSHFSEPHSLSRLIGSPLAYANQEEGGGAAHQRSSS
jgi:ATP-dependent Clp protease ATP-binding subunit ClpA